MGRNDWFMRPDGSMRRGDLGVEAMERQREILEAQLQRAKDEALPMLKGTGFIVIDPSSPRFDGEEFTDVEEAKAAGSNLSYKNGMAIIYAPVLVMRPKRETADTQPSKLLLQLDQIKLPSGIPIASASAPDGTG